jgi:hypothetical protein
MDASGNETTDVIIDPVITVFQLSAYANGLSGDEKQLFLRVYM